MGISVSGDFSRFQLRPGNVINKYKIIRPHAEGVFKEVYLVERVPQLSLDPTPPEQELLTVLKLFKRSTDIRSASASADYNLDMLASAAQLDESTDDPRVTKFFKEVGALHALQKSGGHENIAKIVDAGVYAIGDNPQMHLFFVEEYVRGDTLDKILERIVPSAEGLRQMSPEMALAIFEPVASGMKYLHDNGMAHGDLQPKNIIITPEYEDEQGIHPLRPVITDFGNAHLVTDEEYRQVGSILYRSPEELVGSPCTKSSDIWASGVMLYVALTGKYPFNVDIAQWSSFSLEEKRAAEERIKLDIAYERIDQVTRHNPSVSDALSKIVRSAMERHPDQRIGAKSLYTKLSNERKRLIASQQASPTENMGGSGTSVY